nr:hypothetical protein [Methylomonas koyamae]
MFSEDTQLLPSVSRILTGTAAKRFDFKAFIDFFLSPFSVFVISVGFSGRRASCLATVHATAPIRHGR